jgi:hypothetical protein
MIRFSVMAGLVPAIHVFTCFSQRRGCPAQAGHDELQNRSPVLRSAISALRRNQVICPSGGLLTGVSSPLCKKILVFTHPKSHLELSCLPSLRGAKRRSNPFFPYAARWIASRSLSSGGALRRPVGSQ